MNGKAKLSLALTLLATSLGMSAASTQHSYEHTVCRAGTLHVLAKADKVIVMSVEHFGMVRSKIANDPLDGLTQHCVGVLANVAGKASGNGWCKNVGPTPNDWFLLTWAVSADKPGHGTFTYEYGAGKWKGITGGGTFEPDGKTTPVRPGTYQNCVRASGTAQLPS